MRAVLAEWFVAKTFCHQHLQHQPWGTCGISLVITHACMLPEKSQRQVSSGIEPRQHASSRGVAKDSLDWFPLPAEEASASPLPTWGCRNSDGALNPGLTWLAKHWPNQLNLARLAAKTRAICKASRGIKQDPLQRPPFRVVISVLIVH